MTRRAVAVALGAGALSLGLHAGGLTAFAPAPPERLAGGPPQIAMLGDSFEDATAGRIVASPTATPIPARPEVAPAEMVPPGEAVTSRAEALPRTPPAALPATAVQAAAVAATPLTAATPVLPTAPARPLPAAAPTIQPAPPAPAVAPPAPTPQSEPQPERIAARAGPPVRTPEADTPRPQPRVMRPAPVAPAPAPAPAPAGEGARNARAGQADGAAEAAAVQSARGGTAQSTGDARAAARYPQRVNRHLSRLRRPNARFDGAAVVAFTVAPGGGLAAIGIARSSGNAEFDRIALAHIQRAAPFPPPPPGAQRRFNVTVQGR
jgi:protein TonB